MSSTAISFKGITKAFGHTKANSNISFDIKKGEILALLGENGSGKTTLMNILSGIYYPDSGEIFIDEKPVNISSPRHAYELGIGMVHQHFKLIDVLTVTENIVLGLDGKLNLKEAENKIRGICDRYGFEIDLRKKIYDMSVSEKQTVEIVKVLYRDAKILVLDEPTAVLTPQETEKLFHVMRNMKADGKSIIIITHKLHEVRAISDRVAVLRKGEFIGEIITSESDEQQMTEMMVGRKVSLNIKRTPPADPKPRLIVENLTVKDSAGVLKLKNVSFTANSGEILGIAGISGCGQKELLESIAGLSKAESGSVWFCEEGKKRENLIGKDPEAINQMGVSLAFVPEDRLGMGLVGNMDLADNMMLRSFRTGRSGIFTDRKSPRRLAETIVEELSVDTPGIFTPVRLLSGGNVQKVLLGREISSKPSVIMTAYAVRGLDINSSYVIYDLLNRQKEEKAAIIFVGEDLDVLLALSDRILVLCDGEVSGIVDCPSADKNTLGLLMTRKAVGQQEVMPDNSGSETSSNNEGGADQ
ncbi:MAG: ABC transporter ATP-binding protein [Lachnospiraceae bacterium]|nr:ABC transporter ATP-binding protein [Lachnospiraceae bacterium]